MTTTSPYRAGESLAAAPGLPDRLQERYVFRALLGMGGFGAVYEAWDEVLHRSVAIKLARRDRFAGTNGRQQFLDEARAAAKFKHPHIVTVFDSGSDTEGNPFVVFELIVGESLAARMKRERLPLSGAIRVVIAVAEAIHAAHKYGLIHRDLKPQNILLDSAGQPHVTDFGLAVDEDSQREQAGEVAGSPQYMSPEQIRGETQYLDGRTDIWSLGVILYELLAHRRPFSGRTLAELRDEIQHREPKPLRQIDEGISVALEQICWRCLAKPVNERFSSAADLAAALQQCLAPRRVPTWQRPASLAGGLLAVLAVAGLAFNVWRSRVPFPVQVPAQDNRESRSSPTAPAAKDMASPAETVAPLSPNSTPNPIPIAGTWFPVLSHPPELLQWPADSKNSRWELGKPGQQELWVTCDRRCLLKFGHVDSGNYQIQGDLLQFPWTGGLGLFFGRQELRENGQLLHRLQFLMLHVQTVSGQNKYFLKRGIMTQAATTQRTMIDRQEFATASLPDLGTLDQRFQISIQDDRLARVRWGSQTLSELIPPNIEQTIGLSNSYGDWGILFESGTGIFRNLELFLEPKGDFSLRAPE